MECPTCKRPVDTDLLLAEPCVIKDGIAVKLTDKEYRIMAFLYEHMPRSKTIEAITRAVYGPLKQDWPSSRSIEVLINRIRSKFEDKGLSRHIIGTDWGLGYRINE